MSLDAFTEGDARELKHAKACKRGGCMMCCRCWCHGISLYLNGDRREDAEHGVER